jgi:hypothetical protein
MFSKPGFVKTFLGEFYDFITGTMQVKSTLLFAVLCWVRSVQQLEDQETLFMSKTVFLCRYYRLQRCWNYSKHEAHIPGFLGKLKRPLEWDKDLVSGSFLDVHVNPFLSGCFLLDSIYEDDLVCSKILELILIFRRECHRLKSSS